ncbi:uncharacterized protein FRV6_08862 [Fusarium oxysporum]|uniref:Uncharacterized protein n=1 Tax=Fusarium oxysporum TaxID=5507 RepID=A0A2H3TAN8_FUSOX|nr:uncharacterized protein FRV6_08862 [Fusarium oxysporum]
MTPQQVDVDKIQAIWPHVSKIDFNQKDYIAFWGHVKPWLDVLEGDAHHFYPLGSDDIFWIVEELRRQKESTRLSILDAVKQRFADKAPSDVAISLSVNLAAFLWLNVKVQLWPSPGRLQWNNNQCLVDLLKNIGPTVGPVTSKESLNDELTMERLVTDYGFTVIWTSNLVEHLWVNKKAKIVMVYEHMICLRNHQLAGNQTALPQSLVLEAMDTLNLLFPLGSGPTKSFLIREGKTFTELGTFCRDRRLRLDNYKIWRPKLEELSMVLDVEPVGTRQFILWRNGRNALQFVTFWIATIVAILTVVSFVTGVSSMVYAKKANDIAMLQYQFSLAETCSDPEVAAKLVDWCPKS